MTLVFIALTGALHDGRNVTVVWCVDKPLWLGGTSGGRGGFKWRQPAHRQLWTLQRPNFSIYSDVKTNKKSTFLRRMLSIGIRYVMIASIYLEKTRLKK